MKRRILSAMLTLCMVLSLFPGTAWAAEEIRGETSDKSTASETTSDAGIMPLADTLTYGDLFYVVNDDTIEITDCNIEATSVDIPEQINGCTVTSIGPEAFDICRNLTNVTIPNSVKSIGRGAFLNCNSLSSITIPDSVTSLGDGMFFQCNSLTSVTIPQGITSIGSLMFYGCSSLTDVIIPNSVTDIGNDAFYGCIELANITIPYGVTHIHGTAFSNSGLTSVTIPDSVTYIGNRAFGDCKRLTHVIIPNSVTSIQSAFQGCSKLVSAGPIGGGYSCEFGWSDEIPNSAFSNCNSLTDVIDRKSVV